jgi:molybdenum cofactor synthesis domain-containing protein
MRLGILTVSDSGARGERVDTSGDAIAAWAAERDHSIAGRTVVPDDNLAIVRTLLEWCDADIADVIITTGGTGLSPRDNTPEATRAVIDREAHGIAERLRVTSIESFARAALSRGIAGIRGRTLIVNLPGSTGGVKDGLAALQPILAHAVSIARGEKGDH